MATSKLMASSKSPSTATTNAASRASAAHGSTTFNQVTIPDATLLNAEITLLDAAGAVTAISDGESPPRPQPVRKTVDDIWREIVEGKTTEQIKNRSRECKEEDGDKNNNNNAAVPLDELMTLEDFLAKAGGVQDAAGRRGCEVKVEQEGLSGGVYAFEGPAMGMMAAITPQQSLDYGASDGSGSFGGRGRKRAGSGSILETTLDKAAQQRQRRMIKNRESAARSRERKQAYQVELEAMAVRLEEENEQLLKEKAERTKERFKQLMEKVIPVVDKRRPARILRRVKSMQW